MVLLIFFSEFWVCFPFMTYHCSAFPCEWLIYRSLFSKWREWTDLKQNAGRDVKASAPSGSEQPYFQACPASGLLSRRSLPAGLDCSISPSSQWGNLCFWPCSCILLSELENWGFPCFLVLPVPGKQTWNSSRLLFLQKKVSPTSYHPLFQLLGPSLGQQLGPLRKV